MCWVALGLALASESQTSELASSEELLRTGRYDEAELVLQREVARDPDSARTQYLLGVARMRLGRPEEAVLPLEKARSLLDRGNPGVFYELGTAYLQTERFDEAIETLSQGTAEAPDDSRIRLQLGFARYQRLDAENARAEFLTVLGREPENPQAHFYLALAEAALGRLEESGREFRRTLSLAPDFDDARLGLARTLSQSGDDSGARNELLGIVARSPAGSPAAVSAHNELGLIALRARDVDGAREEFEAVVANRPHDRQATYNLWLLYERLGRGEEADEMRRRFEAVRDDPVQPRSASRTSSKKRPR
jgi:tetratricopeptide (TPR) repeat protein